MKISGEALGLINAHGERDYPEECCGMLLGSQREGVRVIEEVVEIDNSQGENRRRRFLITPRQYIEAEKTAALRNRELLGFYHSHPDHPALPSSFDTEHALPWFIYVIVSVQQRQAAAITAWVLSETRSQFEEVPLDVEPAVAQSAHAGNDGPEVTPG